VSVTVESSPGVGEIDGDTDVDTGTSDAGAGGDAVLEGAVDPADLRVGDCVLLGALADADSGDVAGFDTLSCEQPHEGEVILVDNEFFFDLDAFDEQAIDDEAASQCLEVLEDYTGIAYDESAFDYLTVTPSEQTWSLDDDRGLVCVGFTLNDDFTQVIETTGSIRGEPPAT
jgi:hypothetical protein